MNINKILNEMCNCDCHDDGTDLMHCFPCCNYTYEKRSKYQNIMNVKKEQPQEGESDV